MTSDSLDNCVDTISVSNLHCSSCVVTIEECLSKLSPQPLSVWVSVLLQSVTVHHSTALSLREIHHVIEDAGFDVVQNSSDEQSTSDSPSCNSLSCSPPLLTRKRQRHLEQCSLCKMERESSTYIGRLFQTQSDHTLDTLECRGTQPSYQETDSFSAVSPTLSISSEVSLSKDGPFLVNLAIGGMTCAACSNTVTSVLSQLSGVSEVVVNLLGNSATAVIQRKELTDILTEAVEDTGFESQIISVEPVSAKSNVVTNQTKTRTVSLLVDGMYSQHCPQKIMSTLNSLGSQIEIIKPLSTYTDPILTLTYEPSTPSFTIRTIIAAIASSKSPPFVVSIHRPPTLEQLALEMRVREQYKLLRRLIFSIIVAIPTFIVGIAFMTFIEDGNSVKGFLMEPMWAGNASRSQWALFFLATPVMFYSANIFHRRSIKEIRALWSKRSTTPILRRFVRFGSMNLLVSSGVSVAYFSSIGLLGLAAAQPASTERKGDKSTYFDSVIFLTTFLLAGRFLEAYSKARTADAITALSSLRPAYALLLTPRTSDSITRTDKPAAEDLEKGDPLSLFSTSATQKIEKIPADLLEVGDIVRVPNGSTPPADGIVVPGEDGVFDESSLSGESKLVKKQSGDKVYLGTINGSKMVHIMVDSIEGGTLLDNIVKVVREGQTRRAPIERVADVITGYFVPVITLLAILTWVIWVTLGMTGTLPHDYLDIEIGGWPLWSLEFAIAVFVVACPCGIGLAAPTALLVGSGLAAKFGILARGGGEAFQEMAQLDLIVFDKTGTLTEGGEPRVSDAEIISNVTWERNVVLGIAAELESSSSHPFASAIRQYCEAEAASSQTCSSSEEIAGRGLKSFFPSLECTSIIGNEAWMQEHGAVIDKNTSNCIEVWKSEAKSIVLLAIRAERDIASPLPGQFQIAAVFGVTDRVRSEAASVVSWFQSQGVGTWMISGDNVITATAVARTVGIPSSNVIAGVLPHEKAREIEKLQQDGLKNGTQKRHRNEKWNGNGRCIVAMVGDGINDAPALTAADVGIAIGSGSDVALSSSSFILLSSNLGSLITLSDLSLRIISRVKFNFLWAVVYNLVGLPIAAGVLYPAGHVRLNPVWASLAMALSSVSVVWSSLLLKLYREPNPL